MQYQVQLHASCNNSIIFIFNNNHSSGGWPDIWLVQEFDPIPDGTSSTLTLNGTLELNGTVIRCLIYNGGGSVPTNNFTISIDTAPSPSPVPSGKYVFYLILTIIR